LQEKLLDLERKDQENKTMLQYIEHLCEDELKGLDKHSQDKRHLREELDKCLVDNARRRATAKEQDKILNEKVLQQRKEEDVRITTYPGTLERVARILSQGVVACMITKSDRNHKKILLNIINRKTKNCQIGVRAQARSREGTCRSAS